MLQFSQYKASKIGPKKVIGYYIYLSVAKPYGCFGQKLESLQGRSGPGTGQGNTVQDRSWQRDRSKALEQK